MLNEINKIVKSIILIICVIGLYVFMFKYYETNRLNKISLEDIVERDIKTLNNCYEKADRIYSENWAQACKSQHKQETNECLKAKIPEDVCKENFVFDKNCALSLVISDRLNKIRYNIEGDCDKHFNMKTEAYVSYLNSNIFKNNFIFGQEIKLNNSK